MRNLIKIKQFVAAAFSISLFTSCGGGGGGYAGIDGSGEKPKTQISISGPINGFGSVIVNGVHYDTDNAKVYVRGELAKEQELNVGDYVIVVGVIGTDGEGIANEVHFQPRVTGLVQSLDPNKNRLVIMGQTVQLMEDTNYSSDITPRNIEGFELGDKVTVSGVSDAEGVIRATRIESSVFPAYEVFGVVENVNAELNEFYIDKLKINYQDIAVNQDQLAEGKLVAVSGTELSDNSLKASAINFTMDYRKLRNVDSLEFTGFIKNLSSAGFSLDTLPVVYSSSTEFRGSYKKDLRDNFKVRVTGKLNDQDQLVAKVVELIPVPDTQVYGTIQYIAPAPWGSMFPGFIQVKDTYFWVKYDTQLDGDQGQRISFYDLRVGDSVYISAYTLNETLFSASIAVDNRAQQHVSYEIQGYVYAVSQSQKEFSIYNTRVVTTADTVFGDGYNLYSPDQFFTMLSTNYVQVRGYFDPQRYVMVATRVTFIWPWY